MSLQRIGLLVWCTVWLPVAASAQALAGPAFRRALEMIPGRSVLLAIRRQAEVMVHHPEPVRDRTL
ncbi:MAG: hypothetical protein ABGY72_05855 [bacterium]